MKWNKYKYSYLSNKFHDEWLKEPRIEVVLTDGRSFYPQLAMIDSGASISMLDDEFMDIFNIDRNSCTKVDITGIVGASTPSLMGKINLKINGFEEIFNIPVVFVPKLQTGMLLGQIGFFDNFNIKFENSNDLFYLGRVIGDAKKEAPKDNKFRF